MKKKNLFMAISLILAGLVAGMVLTARFGRQEISLADGKSTVSPAASELLGKFSDSLAEVAKSIEPSVVSISISKTVAMSQNPFGGLGEDPFFRHFFGQQFGQQRQMRSTALGSGVIISKDGYVLTNNHVVQGADTIKVTLFDNRVFTGKVVGTDPKTDVAVVKIKADDLPAAILGDSDKLETGQLVMAVGIPFGLSHTATVGVISAVGRSNVGIADYEDFIQTDAAINPGNSGGALVNTKGEVIGINTAIFSTSGGYMGIGFAIPSNMAKTVMESIIKNGKVIRGWMGIGIQDLNPQLAKSFDLSEAKGALVSQVMKGGPAAKAGLKRGDVITEFDGNAIGSATALRNLAASTSPGTTVKIKVMRDGKSQELSLTLGEYPEKGATTMAAGGGQGLPGVDVQVLSPQVRSRLGIPDEVQGVLVTSVTADSPVAGILQAGDVISEINRKPIKNLDDYRTAAASFQEKGTTLLLIYRDGATMYLTITTR